MFYFNFVSNRKKPRFSKSTGIWTTTNVKEQKSYKYIPGLRKEIVAAHLTSEEPLHTARVLGDDDPRRISKTLTDVPQPTTSDIAKMRQAKSREIP